MRFYILGNDKGKQIEQLTLLNKLGYMYSSCSMFLFSRIQAKLGQAWPMFNEEQATTKMR